MRDPLPNFSDPLPNAPMPGNSLCRSSRMTHLEEAALGEKYARLVDAAIGECFGFESPRMTELRLSNGVVYEQLRQRWLEEGDALLARRQAQKAELTLCRHRRLRELEAGRGGGRFRFASAGQAASQNTPRTQSSSLPSPAAFSRSTAGDRLEKAVLTACRRERLMWGFLLLAAAYFAVGALYPGGWTGAWADWMGAGR